jgi:hypothetical protein
MGVMLHKNPAIGYYSMHNINHKHLFGGASNPKTNNTIQ